MTAFPAHFAACDRDRGGGVLDARRQSKGFAQSTLCFRQLTTDGRADQQVRSFLEPLTKMAVKIQ